MSTRRAKYLQSALAGKWTWHPSGSSGPQATNIKSEISSYERLRHELHAQRYGTPPCRNERERFLTWKVKAVGETPELVGFDTAGQAGLLRRR